MAFAFPAALFRRPICVWCQNPLVNERGTIMSSLNIGQHVTSLSEDTRLAPRCPALTARRARRARLVALAVAASVVATGAIAVGLPATGLAIYLAATLPFAFFS
jgi:hypothetical protein